MPTRLENPDYRGSWEYGVQNADFSMFVLGQSPTEVDALDHSGTMPADIIQGVILDPVGLSIFTGTINHERISFTKIYSERARRAGGLDETFYVGVYVPDQAAFIGEFSSLGDSLGGEFTLTPMRFSDLK